MGLFDTEEDYRRAYRQRLMAPMPQATNPHNQMARGIGQMVMGLFGGVPEGDKGLARIQKRQEILQGVSQAESPYNYLTSAAKGIFSTDPEGALAIFKIAEGTKGKEPKYGTVTVPKMIDGTPWDIVFETVNGQRGQEIGRKPSYAPKGGDKYKYGKAVLFNAAGQKGEVPTRSIGDKTEYLINGKWGSKLPEDFTAFGDSSKDKDKKPEKVQVYDRKTGELAGEAIYNPNTSKYRFRNRELDIDKFFEYGWTIEAPTSKGGDGKDTYIERVHDENGVLQVGVFDKKTNDLIKYLGKGKPKDTTGATQTEYVDLRSPDGKVWMTAKAGSPEAGRVPKGFPDGTAWVKRGTQPQQGAGSSKSQHYKEMRAQGLSHELAQGVAYGLFKQVTDQATGDIMLYDLRSPGKPLDPLEQREVEKYLESTDEQGGDPQNVPAAGGGSKVIAKGSRQQELEDKKKAAQVANFNEYTEKLGKEALKHNVPTLDQFFSNFFQHTKTKDGKWKEDLPGIGYDDLLKPHAMVSEEAKQVRNSFHSIRNYILKERSGAAVTVPEFERFKNEYGDRLIPLTEEGYKVGIELAYKGFVRLKSAIGASYDDSIVDAYSKKLGIDFKLPENMKFEGKWSYDPKPKDLPYRVVPTINGIPDISDL